MQFFLHKSNFNIFIDTIKKIVRKKIIGLSTVTEKLLTRNNCIQYIAGTNPEINQRMQGACIVLLA